MNYKAEYIERKNQVLDLLNNTNEFFKSIEDWDKVACIDKLIYDTENNTFSIVVVGQFSAGKSTFLNALMTEKYLPSFSTETTATINFLKSVKESPTGKELIKVNYKDGHNEECGEVTLENIQKFVSTKGDEVAKKVESVEIFLDSKYLNDGVSLVDSPGLNGILEGHADITNRQIDSSHAAIFLFNAHQPGSKSDFEILKNLTDRCKNVFIVLNQIDLVYESEQSLTEVVESVKTNYVNYFNNAKCPEIYPISAYKALVGRSTKNLDYLGRKGFSEVEKGDLVETSLIEDFENRLMRFLTNGEKTKNELMAPVEHVETYLKDAQTQIEEIINELEGSVDLDEVKAEILTLQDEIDGLKTKIAGSRGEINKEVGEILKEAENEIKTKVNAARDKAVTSIANNSDLEELESSYQVVLKKIVTSYSEVVNEAYRRANEKYTELIRNRFSEFAEEIENKLSENAKNIDGQPIKVTIDKSIFEADVNVDQYIGERNELKKKIQETQGKMDDAEFDMIKAHSVEQERLRLETRLSHMEDPTASMGPRPGVERYTTMENSRGSVRTFFKGAKYDRPVVHIDTSARDAYDKREAILRNEYNAKVNALEDALNKLPKSNMAEIEYTQKKLARTKEELQRQLQYADEEYQLTMKKANKKRFTEARNYLSDYCDELSTESLTKVYADLKEKKEDMTSAALDVIAMGLNDVLNKKNEMMKLKEQQLTSSVDELEKTKEEKKVQIEKIKACQMQVEDVLSTLNSIAIDEIKRD